MDEQTKKFDTLILICTLKKFLVDNADENRDVPAVGMTWDGPET